MSGYNQFAQFYDALTSNIDYDKRADYFDKIIKTKNKNAEQLLDLACGTGSLSLALAARGYDVVAVDSSVDMLSVAMQKQGDAEAKALFLNQAMDRLDLYGTVDATICALDSINHVESVDVLQAAFQKVALFTNPHGLFVFDVNSEYKHRHILADNTFVYDLDAVYCVWQNNIDDATARIDITLDFFSEDDDGAYTRYGESFSEWLYTDAQLRELLKKSGFRVLHVFGDDSFDKPKPDTQRLIYVAEKID